MKHFILLALCFSLPSLASEKTLDDLLLKVQSQQSQNRHIEAQRDKDFSSDVATWQEKLKQAQQRVAAAKLDSTQKGIAFDNNEKQLVELTDALALSKENLGELFGVVRQVSADFSGQIQGSVISAQYPERNAFVNQLAESKTLPVLSELEQLWFVMLQDMTESSKVVPFSTQILDNQGIATTQQVTRLGAFNLIADNSAKGTQYLIIDDQSELPQPLSRPVASDVQTTLDEWHSKTERLSAFYFDPAKGELLTVLSRTPTWTERAQQGGVIGYLILSILLFGLLVAAVRFALLSKESAKIKKQLQQLTTANQDNALGRLLAIYQDNKQQSTQLLELKLEEAILRETPRLERGSSVLKVLAAIAPMMGLLGTVTGMIGTFQSITLFGTGDPKLMAGGISMALITTVMGLIAALPLLLIHSLLHSRANGLINLIEEQSAGFIAQQAESQEHMATVIEAPLTTSKCA